MNIELGVVDETNSKLSSVPEHKSSQVFELGHCIVWETSSLVSFFTEDTNTNISSLNHVDIISTITNRQWDAVFCLILDKSDNFGLLGGRESVSNNGLWSLDDFEEHVREVSVVKDLWKLATWDHETVISLDAFNFFNYSLELVFKFVFVLFKHINWIVFSFEVSARVSNFLGSLTFVTSQHPYFDTCFSEVLDAFNDLVLELIFDGSYTDNS